MKKCFCKFTFHEDGHATNINFSGKNRFSKSTDRLRENFVFPGSNDKSCRKTMPAILYCVCVLFLR